MKRDKKKMKLRYNPKCAVASGLVVGGYWLLAPSDRRVSVALALAVATYAGLAHYDRLYNCDERLESFGGPVSVVTGPFKPALWTRTTVTRAAPPPAPRSRPGVTLPGTASAVEAGEGGVLWPTYGRRMGAQERRDRTAIHSGGV